MSSASVSLIEMISLKAAAVLVLLNGSLSLPTSIGSTFKKENADHPVQLPLQWQWYWTSGFNLLGSSPFVTRKNEDLTWMDMVKKIKDETRQTLHVPHGKIRLY